MITHEKTERCVGDDYLITLTLQSPLIALQRRQINRVYPAANYSDTIKNWLGEFSARVTVSGQWPQHLAFTTFGQTHGSLLQETLQQLKKFSYLRHEKNQWNLIIGDEFPEQDIINLVLLPPSGLTIDDWGILSRERILQGTMQWRVHTNHPSLRLGQCVKLDDEKHYRIVKMELDVNTQRFRNTLWLDEHWQPKLQVKPLKLQHHFATIANDDLQLNYCFSPEDSVTESAQLIQPGSQHGQCKTQISPTPGATALVSYLQGDLQQPIVQGYVNIPSVKPHEHNIWRTHRQYQVIMDDQSHLRFAAPSETSSLTLNFSKEQSGIVIESQDGEIEWKSQGDWSHHAGCNTEIAADSFSVEAHTLRGYSEHDHNLQCQNQLSMSTQQDSRWKAENNVNISAKSSTVSVKKTFQFTGNTIHVTANTWRCKSSKSALLQGNIRIQVGKQSIEISDQSLKINAKKIEFNAGFIELSQHASIN